MFRHYLDLEYPIAAAQLVFTMLGMGAALRPGDFLHLLRAPRALVTGIVYQLVAVPLLAAAWVFLFPLDAGLAVGLFILAAVPGGSLSNVFTWLGGGNVPLSISLTAVLTLGALGTTPLLLSLLTAGALPGLVMPVGRMLAEIVLLLLLPLAAGMSLQRRFPGAAPRLARLFLRGGLVLVGVVVVGALGSGRIRVDAYGWLGPLVLIGFCHAALFGGELAARLAGLGHREQFAIGIEAAARNGNLALLLAVSLLRSAPEPVAAGAVFAILYYGGTALVTGLLAVPIYRARARRVDARAARPPFVTPG